MLSLQLNLDKLKESGLFVEEFVYLQMIHDGLEPEAFKMSDKNALQHLSEGMWIKPTEGGWELRAKAVALFTVVSTVNFDEFWEAFPATTPDGRALRAGSKEWGGKPTRDYLVCKKKYLAKVSDKESHDKIVSIIRARVNSGDYKYINNLETYINQEVWQKDVKYLKNEGDWAHQRV